MKGGGEMAKDSVPKEQEIGEGIRKLKTSNVFRVVNFELYAKPVRFGQFALSFRFFTALSLSRTSI